MLTALRTSAVGAGLRHQAAGSQLLLRRAAAAKRNYHDDLIDHYENPRNVGKLDRKEPNVGTGLVGAPACGDVMQLQIKVDDEGRIIDQKFKTFGCGSAIASSSLATEWLKGKTIDEAAGITNKDIATELKLPPVKLHCRYAGARASVLRVPLLTAGNANNDMGPRGHSMLAADAIKAAIGDLATKKHPSAKKHEHSHGHGHGH